jgi:hypothetical protein
MGIVLAASRSACFNVVQYEFDYFSLLQSAFVLCTFSAILTKHSLERVEHECGLRFLVTSQAQTFINFDVGPKRVGDGDRLSV